MIVVVRCMHAGFGWQSQKESDHLEELDYVGG
jgi:hypothetical protein